MTPRGSLRSSPQETLARKTYTCGVAALRRNDLPSRNVLYVQV